MKTWIKWTTGILCGIALIGIAALITLHPFEPRKRQRAPEGQAASSAVQAALRYSIENEDRLPDTLTPEAIRRAVPEYYKADVPAESVIYLPPKEKNLRNIPLDTIIVMLPVEGGVHVGYAGGHAAYFSSGTNIRLGTGAQQIDDGNSVNPSGDERTP